MTEKLFTGTLNHDQNKTKTKLNLIGIRGDIKGTFSKKYSKFFFLETIRMMKLKLGILA